MIPSLHTVYVNMFGPVDVYQNMPEPSLQTSEEVCGKLISAVGDQAEEWMALASRLDLIESTSPDLVHSFGLSWENSIFYSFPEGVFFKVTAAQYEMLSRIPDQTILIIKDPGVDEVQFMTHADVRKLLHFCEANGRAAPFIACNTETIEQIQELGPIILTTLLFLHVGQIRNLSCEEFTLLSSRLPVGCCHLVSQTQLEGLDFAYFSPERLEALIRGSGAQSEFIARLRMLSEIQISHLISKGTNWIKENIPYAILQSISLENLILSLDMLKV